MLIRIFKKYRQGLHRLFQFYSKANMGEFHGRSFEQISKEHSGVNLTMFRLMVKDEPGVIAKISSLFAEYNLSIEALIQHEDRNKSGDINQVPVVIVSGPVDDANADKISRSLIDLDQVDQHLKQYRIHSDKK